ncbi:MAG: sigma 54-interacting transcriptional regulator [bacterium]|nr:sigma 54-interacting transcriptional regulator [bacterium]
MAPETTSQFRLVVIGDGSIRTIPLLGEHWTIGRAEDCEIQLRDITVSRRHVLLTRTGEDFHLRDLGGRNPILVDGQPHTGGAVQAGQELALGLTRLLLERRDRPSATHSNGETVMITGREVLDRELDETPRSSSTAAALRVLERLEWTFADLGSLADAAEPMLALAMNLTNRRRGLLGQLGASGHLELLATLDSTQQKRGPALAEALLREAQQLKQVSLLTTADRDDRLMIPLGPGPDALLTLEEPTPDAPAGQELLRLADTLGRVIWHRLYEVRERLRLREEVQRLRFHGTTAHSAVLLSNRLKPVRQQLREIASSDTPVLLVGEDGTEREDLARYLHSESRKNGPFVPIHVSMVAAWRLDKTLFGDATGDETSALARSKGGTLFLDDLSRLAPAQQERLAHAATRSERRLVAAAPSPPPHPPESADWSPALTELLLSHVVTVPPLREDGGDVVALAELFLSDMGSAPDGSPRLLSERAKRLLAGYAWPGNVRELRQVLETAAGKAGSNQITPRHLPPEIADTQSEATRSGLESLEDVERRHIRATLKRLGGNRAKTAQALGIAASTLYEKLRRYEIGD